VDVTPVDGGDGKGGESDLAIAASSKLSLLALDSPMLYSAM
jgi:hypothetical protein